MVIDSKIRSIFSTKFWPCIFTTAPQGGIQPARFYFSVPEAGSSRSGASRAGSGEGLRAGSELAVFSVYPPVAEGPRRALGGGSLYKGTEPIMGLRPHDIVTIRRPGLLTPPHSALGFNTRIRRDTNMYSPWPWKRRTLEWTDRVKQIARAKADGRPRRGQSVCSLSFSLPHPRPRPPPDCRGLCLRSWTLTGTTASALLVFSRPATDLETSQTP